MKNSAPPESGLKKRARRLNIQALSGRAIWPPQRAVGSARVLAGGVGTRAPHAEG